MSVTSSASIPTNGDFQMLSNKPYFIWFPIVNNKSLYTVLERFLNFFITSTPEDSTISSKEFSLFCIISCLQSKYKAVKTFSLLVFLLLSLFQQNSCHT